MPRSVSLIVETFLLALMANFFAYAPIVALGHWQRSAMNPVQVLILATPLWLLALACRRAKNGRAWYFAILAPLVLAYMTAMVSFLGPQVVAYSWVPLMLLVGASSLTWWFIDEYFLGQTEQHARA